MRRAFKVIQDTALLGICFIALVLLPQLFCVAIGAPIHY